MPKKTITNFWVFVILGTFTLAVGQACSTTSSQKRKKPDLNAAASDYSAPRTVGMIGSADVKEASGLAASRCQPNVLWTHNDSGDDAFIFAIGTDGRSLGTWKVSGAQNDDWEDISVFKDSSGKCWLYIAETGNTNKLERTEHKIYRVEEPTVGEAPASSERRSPLETAAAVSIRFAYPDGARDAETLLVHPQSGAIYILTKSIDGPSEVFRLAPNFGQEIVVRAEKIGSVAVPAVPNGLLTGGAVSPDGRRVLLVDLVAGYELKLPADAANFDAIWTQAPAPVDLGDRKQGEAATYSADGNSIFAASEGKNAPIIEASRKQ
jgi:hypothetical protein